MGTYKAGSPYGKIQVLFPEEREVSEKERLLAAVGPLLSWYREHRRALPWRETKDPYRIWVSEIMLQQTRVEAVKPYFARFMERFPTVAALADAPEEELLKAWEGLGYYSRAKNLQKAAKQIVADRGGRFPESYGELLALPGIGSYTAGAVASIAFNLPVPAVDGNVLRVLSRVFASREDIAKQSVKRGMEDLLSRVIPEGEAGDFNQALIETGAMICVPNGEPLCAVCPFSSVCISRENGLISEIPVKMPKKKRKIEQKTVLLMEYKDKIAIRKRKDTGLLASLYEFPNVPGLLSLEEASAIAGPGGKAVRLSDAKHVFSHVEWHMAGYFISLSELSKEGFGDVLFAERGELASTYPIPSAFAKYKKYLEQNYGG